MTYPLQSRQLSDRLLYTQIHTLYVSFAVKTQLHTDGISFHFSFTAPRTPSITNWEFLIFFAKITTFSEKMKKANAKSFEHCVFASTNFSGRVLINLVLRRA